MKKILSGILAIGAGIALMSCGEAMHPTDPGSSGGGTVRADAITSEGAGGPTVATDKADYSPGDTVIISGYGWQPNESIDLLLKETPDANPPSEWTVIADSIGSFADRSFLVNESHIGVSFQLIATGAASADTAQGIFTDGPPASEFSVKVGNAATMNIDWQAFEGSTSCGGTPQTLHANVSIDGTATLLDNVTATESIRLTLNTPPTAMTFINWTLGAFTSTSTAECFAGDGSNRTVTANFGYNTTTVVSADLASPQDPGTSITFTATITKDLDNSAAPNGTKVKFYDGGDCTTLGTQIDVEQNVNGGTASVSTSGLSAGPHTIVACYAGKNTPAPPLLPSEGSLPFTISAASVPTTTSVSADPASPSEYGTPVTFTATVTVTAGGAAVTTGDVSFHDGTCAGTELQAAGAVDGSGQKTYSPASSLSVGSHTVVACYEGATGFDTSDGSTVYEVDKISTTTDLTSDIASPQQWGTEIVFTAEVNRTSDNGDVTEGEVGFYDGGTCSSLADELQAPSAVDVNGKVTLTTSSLSVATHTIVACYAGNDTLATSDDDMSYEITKIPTIVTLTVAPASQQYSDKVHLKAVVSPTGVAGSVQFQKEVNGGGFVNLPSAVVVSDDSAAYDYTIVESSADVLTLQAVFTPTDTDHYDGDDDSEGVTVTKENAAVAFSSANLAAVQVTTAGSGIYTGTLNFDVTVREKTPDLALLTAAEGDISNVAGLTATMNPIGGGSGYTLICTSPTSNGLSGYSEVLTYTCSRTGDFALGTYQLDASVTGDYYVGGDTDAFTVYDPTLGFATGGGTFNLDGDRVNFGFTMKYNKSGTNLQGNLIAVRHHSDGTVTRLKSNQLGGLAISNPSGCGIAEFSGKATFTAWNGTDYVTTGNNSFAVSAKDCNNPGIGYDYFWMDAPGDLDMLNFANTNSAVLTGGNISVPHTIGKK